MSGGNQPPRSSARTSFVFRGKELKAKDFRRIQRLIDRKLMPTRQEIARETCRLFGWRRPNGASPVRACRGLLERLEGLGIIRLPLPLRRTGRGTSRSLPLLEDDLLLGEPAGWPGYVADHAPLELRLIVDGELGAFRAYMRRYHYLGDSPLVGESLRYGAWLDEELVALLGWAGATLHNGPRDRYIGWDKVCHRERLHLVVNNGRYLVLPWVRQPNLASRVLGANLRRLSNDWQAVYGHPVLLAETFVDQARFRGTCYRASNWVCVGQTKGWSRHGAQYNEHGQPKAVFVYPLQRNALRQLRAPLAAPDTTGGDKTMTLNVDKLPLDGEGGLFSVLATLTDRRKKRGIRHSLQSVLALATCAVLTGRTAEHPVNARSGGCSMALWTKKRLIGSSVCGSPSSKSSRARESPSTARHCAVAATVTRRACSCSALWCTVEPSWWHRRAWPTRPTRFRASSHCWPSWTSKERS